MRLVLDDQRLVEIFHVTMPRRGPPTLRLAGGYEVDVVGERRVLVLDSVGRAEVTLHRAAVGRADSFPLAAGAAGRAEQVGRELHRRRGRLLLGCFPRLDATRAGLMPLAHDWNSEL